MYEFICIECGEIFPYKAQVYDDPRCIYCGGQLAVQAAQPTLAVDDGQAVANQGRESLPVTTKA